MKQTRHSRSHAILAVASAVIASILLLGCGTAAKSAGTSASSSASVTPASNGGSASSPTSGGASGQTTSTTQTTTTQASGAGTGQPVNLNASAALKASLVVAFSDFTKIPLADIAGTAPGSVYYASDPAGGKYWALATMTPATSAPQQVTDMFQDGGNKVVFSSPDNSSWTALSVVGEPDCYSHTGLPADVEALWGLTDSPGCSTSAGSTGGSATTSVGQVPTLGLPGAFQAGVGFGAVKPSEVFLGGDPTGQVNNIVWASWGAAQATGTGTGYYLGPNEPSSSAALAQVTVVASDLGTCKGTYAYQTFEWSFPQHPGTPTVVSTCTGTYTPSS